MSDEIKKKMGRPTLLDERLKSIILGLAEKGCTIKQIAETIKVSRATLFNWLGKDQDFVDQVKACKSVANDLVELSLFRRATGYSHTAVKMFYDKDRGVVVKEKYIEHYPPSEAAASFWLKNRDPERWRDKQDVEMNSEIIVKIADDEQDL